MEYITFSHIIKLSITVYALLDIPVQVKEMCLLSEKKFNFVKKKYYHAPIKLKMQWKHQLQLEIMKDKEKNIFCIEILEIHYYHEKWLPYVVCCAFSASQCHINEA